MSFVMMIFLVAATSVLTVAGACGRCDGGILRPPLVLSDAQKAALLRALERYEGSYDPQERMVKGPFGSPGYHTTLKGGTVHRTSESLQYAVALLDSGEERYLRRAEDILRRVTALQDQDPQSRTYGIWSWFLEEPLEKMSPPDWNWADFCGHALAQVAMDHRQRVSPEVMDMVDRSLQHAARSIQRRNVGPSYTNIAALGTYVTTVAAELYGLADLREYARARLKRFYDYTMEQGAFTEYNSPTYTMVTLRVLTQFLNDVRDPETQRLVGALHRMAWEEIAQHFHPPTQQWAGPHSRCYHTLLPASALRQIWRGLGRGAGAEPDYVPSLEEHRVPLNCPEDLRALFASLDRPRSVVKVFRKSEPSIVGTTYLHPKYAIGSVNRGDMWNQRRALVAYWGSADKPSYLHVRFLHDGYDFSAAQFFSAQREGHVVAAVNFAIDGGDTHISLDRIKNSTIKAVDLRLRFELGGAAPAMPASVPDQPGGTVELSCGDVLVRIAVPFARLGEWTGRWSVTQADGRCCVDVVFYEGPRRDIRLDELDVAAAALAVSVGTAGDASVPAVETTLRDSRLVVRGGDLFVDVPVRPDRLASLQSAARMGQQRP